MEDFLNEFVEKLNSVIRKPFDDLIESILSNLSATFEQLIEASKPAIVIRKLTESQYVCWNISNDLMDLIVDNSNTNKALKQYHEKEKYKSVFETVENCRNSGLVTNKILLNESVFAFENGKYNISILGFIVLIDDALTIASHNDTTSVYNRLNPILEKLYENNIEKLNNDEYALLSLFYTLKKTMETYSANSDFSKPEPKGLNRHWIMHGRSKRRKTKLDCVKLINFLYGIILLDELANDNTQMVKNNEI